MLTSVRASCVAAPLRRINGMPGLVKPACGAKIAARSPRTLARAEQDKVSSSVDQAAGKTKDAASAAVDRAVDTATKLRGALNQATLDLDITQLVRYNFLVQLVLTAISWAVVFFTAHASAKGPSLNPVSFILLIGVALAGYSTYLSFVYLTRSKKEGLGALDGWKQLNAFYEHATFNFIGAAAALLALFANLGTLMVSAKSSFSIEVLTQAASNTLAAHLVSLAFLTVLIRKITQAYQKLADWSAQLESLKAAMPKFG
ncbi:hypothetical protein MNEG_0040 [Monoraphidium neglectum]|uniref:Uncharacterized protein n=1 Tax=Monoraphidium neglectum TaxID=145388 RepID=A0A0D2KCV8_9CHLO|nr:hypothetical protein MNEG_0040 [Monoraphidium neglectum]KIZ07923.1 hypothetical protein MNEG_0040 [Monoraphidium neglectum]|eukprot:XP_013906942.1 hypothetical protein MNEG_0040 [Monoraphidium neglectum]